MKKGISLQINGVNARRVKLIFGGKQLEQGGGPVQVLKLSIK
jgi:hypothetical protein